MEKQHRQELKNEQDSGNQRFAIKLIFLFFMGVSFIGYFSIRKMIMSRDYDIHTEFKFFLSDPIKSEYRNIYMINRQLYSFRVKEYESEPPFSINSPTETICGIYSYKLKNYNGNYYQQEQLVGELNNRLGNKYNFSTYQDKSGNQKWIEIKYIGRGHTGEGKFITLWFPIKYLNNILINYNQIDENTRFIPKIDDEKQPIPDEFSHMKACIYTMSRQENLMIGYRRFGEEYHRFLSNRKLQQERERVLRVLSASDTVVRVDTSDWLIYFYNLREDRMIVVDP